MSYLLRSASIFLFIVLGAWTLPSVSRAQTADTINCSGLGIHDTLAIGPMVRGEFLDTGFGIRNSTLADSLTYSTLQANRLRLNRFGQRVPHGDSTFIQFRYYADTIGPVAARLTIQPDSSGCSPSTKVITALVADPIVDSATFRLVHSTQEFIGFHTATDSSTVVIHIKNTTFDSVIISGLHLKTATYFRVLSLQSFPQKLYRGESLSLLVSFVRTTVGSAVDSLIITVPNEPTGTEGFAVVGYRSDSLIIRRREPSHAHYFTAVPNPVRTEVRLAGPGLESGTVDIRDVLGNPVASMPAEDWSLDLREHPVPDGIYYIHIMGRTVDGVAVNETVRIVVKK